MLMFNKTADWCRGTTGRAEGEQRGFASLLAFGTGFKHVNSCCIGIFSDFLCIDSLDFIPWFHVCWVNRSSRNIYNHHIQWMALKHIWCHLNRGQSNPKGEDLSGVMLCTRLFSILNSPIRLTFDIHHWSIAEIIGLGISDIFWLAACVVINTYLF